jgi:GNAT superfamily N-acetyltransferase
MGCALRLKRWQCECQCLLPPFFEARYTRNMYTLRPATEADYNWLLWLHHTTMREPVEEMWGWDEARQDAYFHAHFDPTRCQIAQVGGCDVGLIEVDWEQPDVFLSEIQVALDRQGSGLGTQLIRNLQVQAHTVGRAVALQVIRVNRARSLYARLGFEVIGETDTHLRMRWHG